MRITMKCMLVSLLVFLAACVPASASISAQAVEYGPWSAWSAEAPKSAPGLEIESEERPCTQDVFIWQYSRYVYYNTDANTWYASADVQEGDHCRPDSGRWENLEKDAPLEAVGKDGTDIVYEGGWFHEEVVNRSVTEDTVMYRSRTVSKVTCEVTTKQMLLFPEEQRQLTVNFFDDGELTYESSDPDVAVIDAAGMVHAVKVGASRITVRSSKGCQITLEVLVCEKQAHIPDGVYTMRLVGTTNALTQGRAGREFAKLNMMQYAGETDQRFVLTNQSESIFKLHPLKHRSWSVNIMRRNKKIAARCAVKIAKKRDNKTQRWSAIYVPDGSYIIYAKTGKELVLGAQSEGAGNSVGLEAVTVLDEVDRWILVKAAKSQSQEKQYIPPVVRDGASYVQSVFGPGHSGIDFCSNGKRTYVLSSARGTVLEVGNDCLHDYAKTPDARGVLTDPCGTDPGRLGNYVLIDHGNGMTSLYAHLSEVFVTVGDTVKQGSLLGRSGATGAAEETKLYFEMRENGEAVDPAKYLTLPDIGAPITK